MSIDFQSIAQAALRAGPGLIMAWLPGGKLCGSEYDVLNPTRADRTTGNFRINILTGKWADFATGDAGGDYISLLAYVQNINQAEAAHEIERQLGLNGFAGMGIDPAIAPFLANARSRIQFTADDVCVLPVPDDAPPAPLRAGEPVWSYLDAQGRLLGYVRRVNKPGGKKDFFPLTYWQDSGWQDKTWPKPRPLYGQADLATRHEAPVLVVEGEKAADAAGRLFPDFVTVTWPGGSSSVKQIDWSPLAGRQVWLLPDADAPGMKAMTEAGTLLQTLATEIHRATLPETLPTGWDVADWVEADGDAEAWLTGLPWVTVKAAPVAPPADERFATILRQANGQGPHYVAIDPPATPYHPLPIPLLAHLENEILRRVPVQHPLAAQQTALAIAARLAGRHTVTTAGDPTSQYIALAAPSVGDVRPYLHQAAIILEQAGLQPSVRQSRLSVMTQIQKTLWRQPATLYLCSEWGILLQFAKRQPAGSLEMALGMISDLWDAQTLVIDADDVKLPDADGGQQIIRCPHLSMLALLSHDQLATAVKLSEMGRGALEQIQYWILDDDDFTVVDPDHLTTEPYPVDLITALHQLSLSPIPVTGNLSGMMPWVMPPQVQSRFAVAVQPFYTALDALQVHRSARSILTASRLIIRRQANILAYCANPAAPLITEPLIQWCLETELTRLRRLFARFPALSGEDGKVSVYDKVLEFITSEKTQGAGLRALQQYCRPYRNLADDRREELIKQMLADESIVEIQPESKPGARRKAVVYVAKAFVREAGK